MDRTYQFAVELTRMPATVDRILADHTPDERGKCKGCHTDDRRREPWPCVVRWAAERAQAINSGHAGLRRAV